MNPLVIDCYLSVNISLKNYFTKYAKVVKPAQIKVSEKLAGVIRPITGYFFRFVE